MSCNCNCKHHKHHDHSGGTNGLLFEYNRLPQAHHLNPLTEDSSYPYTPAAAIPLMGNAITPFENSLVVDRYHYPFYHFMESDVPPVQAYYYCYLYYDADQ